MAPENHPSERRAAVADLLGFTVPLSVSAARLSAFGWDYDGDGVPCHAEHVVAALQRYLSDELTAAEIEDWANMIECREDVAIAGGSDGWTGETLHELANPVLFGGLSSERAGALLAALDTARR